MEISKEIYNALLEERYRLETGSFPDYQDNNGMGANFIVRCNGNSESVMNLARQTLLIVNYQYENKQWLSLDEWTKVLPNEFVINCEPEKTVKEIEKYKKWWFGLPLRKKLEEAGKPNKWSLGNWIAWLEPKERVWFWWGAIILDENYFVFSTKVLDDPFAAGSLKWLFLGSGALEVIVEDDFMK